MSESRPPIDDASNRHEQSTLGSAVHEAVVTIDASEFDAVGIADIVRLWREAGLRDFQTIACRETGAVVQVEVEHHLDGERLSSLDCVDAWERIADPGDTHLYVVEFTAPKFPPSLAGREDGIIGTCDAALDEHGISVSLVGPSSAISDAIARFEESGLTPDLRKLGSFEGRNRTLDALTERQREVLQTAFELGYYDVPRTVSSDEVAATLDIEASTVVEHLQRAERNILTAQLSPTRQGHGSRR